jgi:hypothetical protein
MPYSLGQAAKACGRSKTTIHRAITSGRLSASRTEAGGYSIDPAELDRVFPLNGSVIGTVERAAPGATQPDPDVVTLERLIAEQRETISRPPGTAYRQRGGTPAGARKAVRGARRSPAERIGPGGRARSAIVMETMVPVVRLELTNRSFL